MTRSTTTAPTRHASREQMTPQIAIAVKDVSRIFTSRRDRVVALEDVDLDVQAGEFVSLIGPSGCGKSTLLRLVADLDTPTQGTIEVFGKPARQARLDQDYGIAFQQAGLLPWRTVASNIELPLKLHGVGATERRARSKELLELVGLHDFARSHPDQLSGGMQQRVAIATRSCREPAAAADGRAVRGPGRDHPRADAERARPDLPRDRRRGPVRHPLDPGGGVPLRPGRGDVAPAGAHRRHRDRRRRGNGLGPRPHRRRSRRGGLLPHRRPSVRELLHGTPPADRARGVENR